MVFSDIQKMLIEHTNSIVFYSTNGPQSKVVFKILSLLLHDHQLSLTLSTMSVSEACCATDTNYLLLTQAGNQIKKISNHVCLQSYVKNLRIRV